MAMTAKRYLLSLPERVFRSVLGLGAGDGARNGEVALPDGIRRSQLYQNLVDATLRYIHRARGRRPGYKRWRGDASRRFPVQADRRQRRRTARHRRISRIAGVDTLGSRRPLWLRPTSDPGNGRGTQSAGFARTRTRSSPTSINCWTAWNGRPLEWHQRSTRRRSTSRDSASEWKAIREQARGLAARESSLPGHDRQYVVRAQGTSRNGRTSRVFRNIIR